MIYSTKKSNSYFHGTDCRKEKDILIKAAESLWKARFWLWGGFYDAHCLLLEVASSHIF